MVHATRDSAATPITQASSAASNPTLKAVTLNPYLCPISICIDNDTVRYVKSRRGDCPHDRLRNATGSACALDQLVSPGSFQFSRGNGGSFRSLADTQGEKGTRGETGRREKEKERGKRREIRSVTGKRTTICTVGGNRETREKERRGRREKERGRVSVRGVPC